MKIKKISCVFITTMMVLALVPLNAFAYTSNNAIERSYGTYYERPEAEVNAELEAMAAQALAADIQMRSASDNVLMSAPPTYEYQTVMRTDKTKYSKITKLANGQLAGGYRIAGGGSLYYNPEGGASYSVSVSLGSPWGSISFGGSTGQKAVSGMNVPLPDGTYYYVIWAEKTYKTVPYELQKRKAGSKDPWVTYSYKSVTTMYSAFAFPKRV